MDHRALMIRARQVGLALAVPALLTLLANSVHAQGPQFDVGSPPGAAGGASAVGQPPGAAAFPDFGSPSNAPFSGRPGPMGSHIPARSLSTPGVPIFKVKCAQTTITQSSQPLQITQIGELELPAEFVNYPTDGRTDGMNLDTAIGQLVEQNLDLLAAKLEVPMAEADVLTANLRSNPILTLPTECRL